MSDEEHDSCLLLPHRFGDPVHDHWQFLSRRPPHVCRQRRNKHGVTYAAKIPTGIRLLSESAIGYRGLAVVLPVVAVGLGSCLTGSALESLRQSRCQSASWQLFHPSTDQLFVPGSNSDHKRSAELHRGLFGRHCRCSRLLTGCWPRW